MRAFRAGVPWQSVLHSLAAPRQPRHGPLPHGRRRLARNARRRDRAPDDDAGRAAGVRGRRARPRGAWGEDARRTMPWGRPESWDTALLGEYRRLIALRRSEDALARGGIRYVFVGAEAIAYLRETPHDRLLPFAPPPAAPSAPRAPALRPPRDPFRRRPAHRGGAASRRRPPPLGAALNRGASRGSPPPAGPKLPPQRPPPGKHLLHPGRGLPPCGRRAAARRRRCGWSPASRRSPAAAVAIGGRVVNDLPPKDRDIAMVFQNYALYPHMTVADNIAFGLRLRKIAEARHRRARRRGGRSSST